MHYGPYSFYSIDIVRDGAIRDFIDTDKIYRVYSGLGITTINLAWVVVRYSPFFGGKSSFGSLA